MIKKKFLLLSFVVGGSSLTAAPHFEKEVWPIIRDNCVSCHGPTYTKSNRKKTAKAGLRVDSAEAMMKGSEDGSVIKAGDASSSSFYTLTALPEDHDDIMPPPKNGPLKKEEIDTLEAWIDAGAKFGDWKKAKAFELDKIFTKGYEQD